MVALIRTRTPLFLIALAIAWQFVALWCGHLADGMDGSILYASAERGFLLLATLPTLVAATLLVARVCSRERSCPCLWIYFQVAVLIVTVTSCCAAAFLTDIRFGLPALGAAACVLILLDLRLPHAWNELRVPAGQAAGIPLLRTGE